MRDELRAGLFRLQLLEALLHRLFLGVIAQLFLRFGDGARPVTALFEHH